MNKGAKNSRAVRNGHVVVEAGVVAQPTGDISGGGACTMASRKGGKDSGAVAFSQYRYSAKEQKIIPEIGKNVGTVDGAARIIGKLVDEIIQAKGGIKYGDETFGRIAVHPDVNCSAQYLRRCWSLHRVFHSLWDRISPDHRKICNSSQYQIARLYELRDDEPAMLASVNDCIQKTIERDLAVDEVREMVSRRLDEFGKLRKAPASKSPKESTAQAKVAATDEFDLVEFADSISWMSDPDKFEVHRIAAPETRMGVTRLLSEVVSILRRLTEAGPNHDLGNTLIKRGLELGEIGRQLLEPSVQPEEDK